MTFSQILGQDRPLATLKGALKSDQLHHAYLFGGPDGVGKELTARTLAQAANCEKNDGEACGACGSCRRITARNHPDVMLILPEAEQVSRGWAGRSDFDATPSREIKIAQVRRLQERLALRSLEARRRMVIIVEAQAMNAQAQNALLKTLEEPPAGTTLVLTTASPNALLATIRSRCLKLAFGPLPLDVVARRVEEEKKVDADAARLCAALSGGSLSAALAVDAQALTRRRDLIERVEALEPRAAQAALGLAADFAEDRGAAEVHLDLLAEWYRDVAAIGSGADEESLANRDLVQLARRSAERLSVPEAISRIERCGAARSHLKMNASPRLQLEMLLLRFVFPDT